MNPVFSRAAVDGPRACSRSAAERAAHGTSLIEMLLVVSIIGVVCAIAIPELLTGLDDLRTRTAARYLAARFQDAHLQAVKRSTRVGVRFVADGADYQLGTFADGNRNGVRARDVASGDDQALIPPMSFASLFPHVHVAIGAGVPLIDGGTGSDAVAIGSSDILTFSPDGTSSAGSVYLLGDGGAQYAVRVLGVTGRTRVFRYQRSNRAWIAM